MSNIEKRFYDDNHNPISEEEFRALYQEFENKYKRRYEEIVTQIINQINQRCSNDRQKLKMLFDFLTSADMKYDLRKINAATKNAVEFNYSFPPYKTWGISSLSKYAVILCHSGVCRSYSEAYEDIANRMGIPCKKVTGFTGLGHGWNVVMEDGVLKHIDVSYAIMFRSTHDKYDYFMKTFEELQQIAGPRTMNNSTDELQELLRPKFKVTSRTDNLPPNFKVTSRTDNPSPTIEVISRTDNPPPKIKVIKRTDRNDLGGETK